MTVVLDTHVAIWWSFFPEKLSTAALRNIAEADALLIPAVVLWETSLLVRKRRLQLPISPDAWLHGLQTLARVRLVSLDASSCVRADALVMHDDPADRFIVATALAASVPLITRDALIRDANIVSVIW